MNNLTSLFNSDALLGSLVCSVVIHEELEPEDIDGYHLREWLLADAENPQKPRACPGYDPERHYCKYHCQDFELNHDTVLRLKMENHRLRSVLDAMEVGECELTLDGTDGCFGCSECFENIPPLANFCPNCGRKVKR